MGCEINFLRIAPLSQSAGRRSRPSQGRLRLAQAAPIIGDLGLGKEQRTQLALLLRHKHTDNLPAQFRHAHPTRISDALESDHHRRGDMKLHGELTAGTILGRQPRPQDNGIVHDVLASLDIPPAPLSDLVTPKRAVDPAIRPLAPVVTEITHSAHARPTRTPRPLSPDAPMGRGLPELSGIEFMNSGSRP